MRRPYAPGECVVAIEGTLDEDRAPPAASSEEGITDARDLANQPPVIRFVNLLIREAHEERASDIHLEATRVALRVRLRVVVVLAELSSLPKGLKAAVGSQMKLLAGI